MNRPEKRERYMRDPCPIRLGNLASSLARVSSFAALPTRAATIPQLLDECKWFIEWTGPEVAPDIQPDLVRMQVDLALWQLRWERGEPTEDLRNELAREARAYSDLVLRWSGLLDDGPGS